MIILFVLGLLLGVTAVFFALQNTSIITVTFFSWHLTGSLALILSIAIITGVITTILLVIPESIKNYFKYKNLKKENERIEEELRKQKELTVFAKHSLPAEEDISKIEHGATDIAPSLSNNSI
jgi:uncharacterized integral membrane protein